MTTVSTASPRSRTTSQQIQVVSVTVATVLVVNLLIYTIGRICGGQFTYQQSGQRVQVDAIAVAIMTALPLTIGLAVIAWQGRRRPKLATAASIAAPVIAVATIALMTIPAHFDTTSTMFLSAMHLARIPAALLAIRALTKPTKD